MVISVRKAGDVTILDLEGPLKIGEAEQAFRKEVQALLESGVRSFAVNLTHVPMIDSSGIGAITRIHRTLSEHGGKMIFYGAPKMVRKTLKMVGLETYLGMFEDEASALAGS